MSRFSDFPIEIHHKILADLDLRRHLFKCAQVSRLWYKLCQDFMLDEPCLCMAPEKEDRASSQLLQLLIRQPDLAPRVRSLRINGAFFATHMLLFICTSVEEVILINVDTNSQRHALHAILSTRAPLLHIKESVDLRDNRDSLTKHAITCNDMGLLASCAKHYEYEGSAPIWPNHIHANGQLSQSTAPALHLSSFQLDFFNGYSDSNAQMFWQLFQWLPTSLQELRLGEMAGDMSFKDFLSGIERFGSSLQVLEVNSMNVHRPQDELRPIWHLLPAIKICRFEESSTRWVRCLTNTDVCTTTTSVPLSLEDLEISLRLFDEEDIHKPHVKEAISTLTEFGQRLQDERPRVKVDCSRAVYWDREE